MSSDLQTVHDGNTFKPVVGGFHSGKIAKKGFYERQFNLGGEYIFAWFVSKTFNLEQENNPYCTGHNSHLDLMVGAGHIHFCL